MKYLKKQQAFDALIKNASSYFTVESLCEGIGLTLPTYYKWTADREDIRKEVNSKLAKRFTMRKQATEDGKLVTIEISYIEAERAKFHQYKEEERERMIELICYAYELGVSIHESCKALEVHPSTFFKWVNLDSPIGLKYASDRFKLAKQTRQSLHNEELTFQARTQLSEKLKERKVTNTTLVYEIKGGDETAVLKERRESEKTYMPEMSAIALTLNNLDPDFRKATAGGQMIQDERDLEEKDEAELMEMLREERDKNRRLTGNNISDGESNITD